MLSNFLSKNKGKILLLVVLSLMLYLVSCSPKGSNVNIPDSNKKYYDMTFSEFENYEPAKQEAVWGKIDFYLLNAAIFHKTNKIRHEKGKKQLKYFKGLEKAAQGHSKDMIEQEFYAHNNPYTGKTPSDRMDDCGVTGGKRAENCAGFVFNGKYTYLKLAHIFVYQKWWNSPGHKAIMMDNKYSYLGLGSYAGDTNHLFPNQNAKWPSIVSTQNYASIVPE